jgi:hypothetical protein
MATTKTPIQTQGVEASESPAPPSSHSEIVPAITHYQPVKISAMIDGEYDKTLIILGDGSQILIGRHQSRRRS